MEAHSRARSTTKVLRIIARLNIGGPARHVVLLDEGLRSRGRDTLLVHGSVDAGEASFERLASEIGIPVLKVPELGRSISPIGDARAFVSLLKVIFRRRPDVIHTHTAKAGAVGRIAAAIYNVTRRRHRRAVVVHTFHGHVLSGYFHPAANVLVRVVERCLARITDRVVTISPAQQHDIVERFRIAPRERTVVVPLGLDLERLLRIQPQSPTLRVDLGISDHAVVVGYVGRFVPIKDLPTLVEAFAAALERHQDLILLLAGDGPVRTAVESRIHELGIERSVRLIGWCDDLPSLYATLDIAAISSLNEGTPVALIEAMAAGKPVVATAVGGVPDVVKDGQTGMLVPAGNVERFSAALLSLASDARKRQCFGNAARTWVAERFSSERLVDDIDRLYAEALTEKREP